MSIAEEIVRQVCELALQHDATGVESVAVETGVMRLIEHETLAVAFAAAAVGTPAEGADLMLTDVEGRAKCRACEHEYGTPDITDFMCPKCGAADAEIVSGNDIVLLEIEMAVPEEG